MSKEGNPHKISLITEQGRDKNAAIFQTENAAIFAYSNTENKNQLCFVKLPEEMRNLGLPYAIYHSYGDIELRYEEPTYLLSLGYRSKNEICIQKRFTKHSTDMLSVTKYTAHGPANRILNIMNALRNNYFSTNSRQNDNNREIQLTLKNDQTYEVWSDGQIYDISPAENGNTVITPHSSDENDVTKKTIDVNYKDFHEIISIILKGAPA